jgi:GTP cyclohydrolase IA
MGSAPPFAAQVESRNGVARISLSGELETASVPVLTRHLALVEQDAVTAITLDLQGLTFVDSAGLYAFLQASDRAKSNNHRLILVGASPLLRRLFELTDTQFLLDEREAARDLDRLTPGADLIDLDAAERAIRNLLVALGQDPDEEGLRDTPRRVAASYRELLSSRPFQLTTFPNEEGYDQLIIARSIRFSSLCMHHPLPFTGYATVGYIPKDRILGLSKLARVVETFARRLQVQERMTSQIANWLQDNLRPKGVGVVLEAEHMCMSIRGVQQPGATTVTSALLGVVRSDPRTRLEFLSLAHSEEGRGGAK